MWHEARAAVPLYVDGAGEVDRDRHADTVDSSL